jgi:rubredoxin
MESQKLLEYDCYFCDRCRVYVYDENAGDPERRIWPRTLVEQLPSTWRCPVCGGEKNELRGPTLPDRLTPAELQPDTVTVEQKQTAAGSRK